MAEEEGDWCVVHAGAGGTGSLLVQMAKLKGFRVISTSSKARLSLQRNMARTLLCAMTICLRWCNRRQMDLVRKPCLTASGKRPLIDKKKSSPEKVFLTAFFFCQFAFI